MRKISFVVVAAAICVAIYGADWPTQSGSPHRDGWARAEKAFTKENASDIDLLYKYKADNKSIGRSSLTTPIVSGLLITYLGFKEMLVFAGSADTVYSVDADLNRLIWKRQLEYKADKQPIKAASNVCPGGLTASMAMAGSSSALTFGRRRPSPRQGARRTPIGGAGFGQLGAYFVVSSDGYLHTLNTSTGGDLIPPVKFVPPNSRVSSLNVENNIIYAATSGDCGGNSNAVYAIDLSSDDKKISSFDTHGSGTAGIGGTTIGADGTVYVQIASGHGEEAGIYNDTVVALDAETLKVKDYFTPSASLPALKKDEAVYGVSPVFFSSNGKNLLVVGSRNGRLYVLDTASLGGADHHTPLSQTDAIATPGRGFIGAFSTWQDSDTATRWLYAPISGPVNQSITVTNQSGPAPDGSIVAFKVVDQNGIPVLTPSWVSENLTKPAPPVTANGLVFALSTGAAQNPRGKGRPAVFYVLDGTTGKKLYSSGNAITSYSFGSGITVANGRAYMTTNDNLVYCFGFSKSQPQLTDR